MTEAASAPHLFVIIGATGDLAHRKLLPALFHLIRRQEISRSCFLLGASRSDLPDGDYREQVRDSLLDCEHDFTEDEVAAWVGDHVFYQGTGTEDPDYDLLKERIERIEKEHSMRGDRVLYLAIPPGAFEPTIRALGEAGLNASDGWTRVVIEKPFGRDLGTAQQLNELVHRYFDEEQIYRIDHYLGKETVQNLLAFRFANLLFESVWSRDRIERIEIVASETLGLAGRAGYYDRSGALRDMIQNHLTQLFALVAMEPPSAFNALAIRREKVKLLDSVRPIDPEANVTFGQYTSGAVDGEPVPGYRDEEGVDDSSDTETFVEMRLEVDNWRWQGVPFVLRTGKRLSEKSTRIAIRFRRAPVSLFQPFASTCALGSNVLVITLQPDEGFDLYFEVKGRSSPFQLETQQLRFRYGDVFEKLPDAYETLLLDIIEGDQTLFVHADEVEHAWRLYTPILEAGVEVHPYPAGSDGPEWHGETL